MTCMSRLFPLLNLLLTLLMPVPGSAIAGSRELEVQGRWDMESRWMQTLEGEAEDQQTAEGAEECGMGDTHRYRSFPYL
ncbi:MAG: hypothetical protein HY267_08025 [Deltaproteobacteria bacterium]|nr:hypothetical protein [Deltaproteobacteria bacterium]